MSKILTGAMAGITCLATVLAAAPAMAQPRDRDRDGRPDWRDRHDNRTDHRWRNYGGRYGYNGYRGRWRTGQRYTHWNDRRYYVDDWRAYNLPPPRRGYRYYRDDNGDIVMAAIATGVIGLILGSQLGR